MSLKDLSTQTQLLSNYSHHLFLGWENQSFPPIFVYACKCACMCVYVNVCVLVYVRLFVYDCKYVCFAACVA